ncbi:MAG: GDP-mannose 4,6-dehydratase [Deltaproteobacteria bacterium]|nr:GDP-mannose 4,6-dehydratase [Deltaproteobacteria bacterium]
MARILITGGAGFIGSNLADYFVHRGYDISVLDDFSSGKEENLNYCQRLDDRKSTRIIRGDICDPKKVEEALLDCDYVFHLAALRSVPKSFETPQEYEQINVLGTLKLLEASRVHKIKKFIFASSSSVYGNSRHIPAHEDQQLDPISPYAVSKLNGEHYCRMYFLSHGLPTVSLRYFNVFGPRQSLENKYAVVIPKFIQCLYDNKPPPIYGDGGQTRDFTYVENLAFAHEQILKSSTIGGVVFNAACGNRCSVLKLCEKLNRLMRKDIKPSFFDKRPGDVLHTQSDISKITRLTDYRPQIALDQGLEKTAKWFLSHPHYLKTS